LDCREWGRVNIWGEIIKAQRGNIRTHKNLSRAEKGRAQDEQLRRGGVYSGNREVIYYLKNYR